MFAWIPQHWTLFFTAVFSGIFGVIILFCCLKMNPAPPAGEQPEDRVTAVCLNLMVAVAAAVFGWLVGMALSPFSNGEKTLFAAYAGAVSAFVTGYLAGKSDDLIKYLMDPANYKNRIFAYRAITFVTTLLLTLVVVFLFRFYTRDASADATTPTPTVPEQTK